MCAGGEDGFSVGVVFSAVDTVVDCVIVVFKPTEGMIEGEGELLLSKPEEAELNVPTAGCAIVIELVVGLGSNEVTWRDVEPGVNRAGGVVEEVGEGGGIAREGGGIARFGVKTSVVNVVVSGVSSTVDEPKPKFNVVWN